MNHEELSQLMRALAFAAQKHKNQRRKGIEQHPYINHPIALAAILVDEGGITDLDVICSALLHDTIEDTKTTEQELRETFGATIAGMVVEVTDDKNLAKAERKARQVEHAPGLSTGAKLVKLADKIANLRDILEAPPDWSDERKREYFAWANKVVDGLRGVHAELELVFDQTYERRS
ncbi:MAG: HD domain-containing protein [Gammaproteobacteria bacterium]|nr:HD domain-containing protein [Gammaproteobacteria bacterium]